MSRSTTAGDGVMVCGLNIRPEGGHYPKVDAGDPPFRGASYPPQVRWMEKKDNPPPDFSNTPHPNVSERAKQVIERLEPGVHTFLPVEFLNVRRRHLENRYWFRPGQRIDSLDPERSTLIMDDTRMWRPAYDIVLSGKPLPAHIDPDAPAIKVFSAKAIGQAHIW